MCWPRQKTLRGEIRPRPCRENKVVLKTVYAAAIDDRMLCCGLQDLFDVGWRIDDRQLIRPPPDHVVPCDHHQGHAHNLRNPLRDGTLFGQNGEYYDGPECHSYL